ncbi:MAG: PQQ-like beta-propeller repeat protein [Verrucomicrobia bacterium]|nr:PQQ-like beta-propeller repeat protein [Verrucomicrobiota bacterium]
MKPSIVPFLRMLSHRSLSAAALAAFLAAASPSLRRAAAEEWPQWRGPRRDGISRERLLATDWLRRPHPLLWEAEVGTGFSSIAVAEGKAVTMGNARGRDQVICFDAADGRELWRYSYRAELGPKYYEGGPGATPTIDRKRVYTISKWGQIHCLELESGRALWSVDLRKNPGVTPNEWGFAGSALVREGVVYFNAASAGIALNAADGRILWHTGPQPTGYASPVWARLGGKETLLIFAARRLVGIDPRTGRELWSYPWRTGYANNNADPIVSGSAVFITSYDRGAALLDLSSGKPKPVYANKALQTHMAPPALIRGHLYGFSRHYARRPQLRCVEFASGKVAWSVDNVAAGSVLGAAEGILALYGDGVLALFRATPQRYEELARFRALEGRCWTPPALADGRLYVRNARGRVRCYRIGPEPNQ